MDPTRLPPKSKLEVLTVAVVGPGVIARVAGVERMSASDVAMMEMGIEGVTAAPEAVSRIWVDCPGVMLIVAGEAVTPEGRPPTVMLMALSNLPTAVAATVTA